MDEDIRYFLSDGQSAEFPIKTGPWMNVTIRGYGNQEQSYRMRLRLDPGRDINFIAKPPPGMGYN